MSKRKLLVIGSIPHQGLPITFGGTTVLMKSMLDYLGKSDIQFSFISTNNFHGRIAGIRNYIFVILSLLKNIWNYDIVMVNSASNGAKYLSPILFLISKVVGKRFVFRMFGGNFIELYQSSRKIEKWLLRNTIFESNILLFETKDIISRLPTEIDRNKVAWLPNVRKSTHNLKDRNFRNRFVFIGHVKKSKGVLDIIDAASKLSGNYSIDIYGPITDSEITVAHFHDGGVNYKGVLEPDKVIETLNEYDVLLLPSYHLGEGHPGIILEALSLGIPVISTTWKAIPEVVQNNWNGLLVPIKSPENILNAISFFNTENYTKFSVNAKNSFQKFDEEVVYKNLLNKIHSL